MTEENLNPVPTTPTELTELQKRAEIGAIADQVAASYVFTDYLSRKSIHTIKAQKAALDLFGEYLAIIGISGLSAAQLQHQPQAWQGITWGIVEGFVKFCLQEGYAMGTVNHRLSTVKTYTKLAAKAGIIAAQELQLIKTVTSYGRTEAKRVDERRPVTRVGEKKAEPVRLTPDQAKDLKNQPNTPQGRRDRLLMCLLLDLGLRIGEVLDLLVENFDLERGELQLYRSKVDKEQTHELTGDSWRAAKNYIQLDASAEGPLLLASRKGGKLVNRPISLRGLKKRVTYLGQKIGSFDLSPHDCRHFWATDAARNGTDPFRLQEAGGWSSLAMPRHYVETAEIANKGVMLTVK